ncbi:MAG: LapA family protein [Gammaproteobacteria bacterium]|jgi:putative membrane protein
MKRIISLILLIVLTVITVTFTLLNSQPVKLNYYFGSYELDLLVVMIICLAVGAMLGVLAGVGKFVSLKQELMRKDKKIKLAERELENLRSLPLKDDH